MDHYFWANFLATAAPVPEPTPATIAIGKEPIAILQVFEE
jgi:hypothetical protein